ncbi:acetate--CoA ligase family protein [Bradyrhizobium sp. BR 1432]|uniref:acetate--CoA ligase family protein n=1 Tax=Bradyrhizobium sp. BR 1432 TaxID=3447966 RepID=UPI003EE723CD
MNMNAAPTLRSVNAIDRVFWPESVAIIGASPKGGFATDILNNLNKWGFSGKLAAVNPRYKQIQGVPCYPNLRAVPHPVGLAVLSVRSNAIPDVLKDCETVGVGAIQIISSGFADEGTEGVAKQRRLVEWAERTGIPVVGPNCNGLLNAANGLIANGVPFRTMKPGGVSAVLQSGMLVSALLMPLLARGIGVGRVVTTGNEACVDVADFINYLVDDEATRVIACYCEQFKRPLDFIKACERAADRGKPIAMIKVGRSEGARQAALAHTGSLVGSDVAIDVLLKKLGVVRVDTIDDLIETAAALSSPKRPRGRRVAFASVSGGANSILSDLAEPCGIEFAPVSPTSRARLEALLPEFGSVGNPLDVTGQVGYDTQRMGEFFKVLGTSGDFDVVAWGGSYPSPLDMGSGVGLSLKRAAEAAPEVVFPVMSFSGGHFYAASDQDSSSIELKAEFQGMPFLQGMGTGLKALSALIGYSEFLRERKSSNQLSQHWGRRSERYQDAVRLLREAKGGVLTEREGKRLLALYGIPVTREALATGADEAGRIAQDLTFPVVMKVESAEILHKTDIGGVVLNISSAEAAAAAFDQIIASVRSCRPEAKIAGMVVQEMAKPGIEVMLGAKFDPQFGPVIAFGLGGIWVEALKDVRVLMPPFDAADVQAAIGELRAASVLRGARGGTRADLDGLAECIVKFGTLCADLADEIGEIDINPIILAADGKGLTAVDCLIARKQTVTS